MRFRQAIPPGPDVSPEELYTGLRLDERAGGDCPYVVCNFVSSADGRATAGGRTAPLANEGDKAAFHLLRTQVAAVLAGTGTLGIERYGVPVRDERLVELRLAEGRPAQPLAVVISRSGDIPYDIPLFADGRSRIVLYGPAGTAVPDLAAEVTVHEIDPAHFELGDVLRSLRRDHDVRSLLCEGGPVLFNALLAEDLVDELFLTIAPVLVGGGELGITSGAPLVRPSPLRLVWALEHDENLLLRYARRSGASHT
jgi:riboflavin biosynthesis pyrimidine reductase